MRDELRRPKELLHDSAAALVAVGQDFVDLAIHWLMARFGRHRTHMRAGYSLILRRGRRDLDSFAS